VRGVARGLLDRLAVVSVFARVGVLAPLSHAPYRLVAPVIFFARGDNSFSALLPLLQCWALDASMWDLHGTYDDKGRMCYSFFIAFCGAVAVLSFLLLTLTSLHWVRRHYYKLFYYCHVVFASVSLVALLIHWKRMVFYV